MVKDGKINVLIVDEKNEQISRWISSILNKNFDIKECYILENSNDAPFFLIRWLIAFSKFRKKIKEFKPKKILICGSPLISIWIVVFLVRFFDLKIEIILFRYDIENFRLYSKGFEGRLGHFVTRFLEKYCMLRSDKIIHKGLKNELEFLPFYEKLKDKPHYLFREFLNPKLNQKYNSANKLSKKDNEIHLVFVGNLHLKNLPYADSIWEFYPKITNQKMHLHLYSKVDKKTETKLRAIDSKNPYFHYEGFITYESLTKEISKYDYGITLHGWNRDRVKVDYYSMTSIGNKYFDYMLAKLPILVLNDLKAVVELIDKYKVGYHLSQEELFSLEKFLVKNKKNYSKLIGNIDKAIPQLLDRSRFIEFIKL